MITGNYNLTSNFRKAPLIIPYQVITGNYNNRSVEMRVSLIIPYQVITGNYNVSIIYVSDE